MAKGKKRERPAIIRCDKLPTHMNPGKRGLVRDMMRDWRIAAAQTAAIQWRCFFEGGRFDPYYDPATGYRKAGAATRTGLLTQIGARFGLVAMPRDPDAKRRLPAMTPGLIDPLASMKSDLGAAQVQMVRDQVLGTLTSFLSNRQNDFRDIVLGSTLNETTRHMLFVVNKSKAWFDLSRTVVVGDVVVPKAVRHLARKIMTKVLERNRFPRMDRINMVVDQRIATLSQSTSATGHDWWLRLSVARGTRIDIPVKGFDYFHQRRGARAKSFQIVEDREDGRIYVGVLTDVADAFETSRECYAAIPDKKPVALDFGLVTMLATDRGNPLGRGFKAKLQSMDRTIAAIARHVQRSGQKPRMSKRYCAFVARIRGFIRTEMNRVVNRLIEVRKPSELFVEKLDFRSPDMSARMNRLVQNCGRAVLATKLAAISQEFGIEAIEVVSAYTSQTCSCCGYADKRNRKAQKFECRFCGTRIHADVNASRNVGSERFRSFGSVKSSGRGAILGELVSRFAERYTRGHGAPSDPRSTNPYFAGVRIEARSSTRAETREGMKLSGWLRTTLTTICAT